MECVSKPRARHCFWITRFLRNKDFNLSGAGQKSRHPSIPFIQHNPNFHFSCPTRIPQFQQKETKCCHSQSRAVHQRGENKQTNKQTKNLGFWKAAFINSHNLKYPLAMITTIFDVASAYCLHISMPPQEWGRLNESSMVGLERNA